MLTCKEFSKARDEALKMIREAGIGVSNIEIETMDVADFGLSNLRIEGAQIVSLIETSRIALRIIVLFPGQTEPEHWHTNVGDYEGKQEILRVISGELYLYLPGKDTLSSGVVPNSKEKYYTVRNEVILHATDTITIPVGTKHWFQAGKKGAVVYCVSTLAIDGMDPFTNPNIVRKTIVV